MKSLNDYILTTVTITFNNYSELMDTVESLRGLKGIEHLIINGGNCYKTRNFLNAYSGKSVSEKDSGISDAFNKGLKHAGGDAVWFLNSGDKLIDQSYILKARQILSSQDVDFIYSDIIYVDAAAGSLHLKSGDSLPKMPFLHPTLIVKKEVFDNIGGFDLAFKSAMDLDFAYRLVKSEYKGLYLPGAVVEMDGAGISSSKPFLGLQEKISVVRKNQDYSFQTQFSLLKNLVSLGTRVFICKAGLSSVVATYRKKRYKG